MDQMDNKDIASAFELLAQLMEIHGQNEFRAKAIAAAAYRISKLPYPVFSRSVEELNSEQGIGNSMAQKIHTLLSTGSLPELETLLADTPAGIVGMLRIKGLGPKKIRTIWKELGLETPGEVYYACNENRLVPIKGFGLKTQEQIKKAIEFSIASQGWVRYAQAEPIALQLIETLRKQLGPECRIAVTGEFRRKKEILQTLDILIGASEETITRAAGSPLQYQHESGLRIRLIPVAQADFDYQWLLSTGSEQHLEQLLPMLSGTAGTTALDEAGIYGLAGLPYIEPELREGLDEITLAREHRLPRLIETSDLKGTLHNHSTYSDGVHTLEEMARYCRDEMGLEYFGIADHSKTAVYAGGLSIERVREQWGEIDRLNIQLAPFRIFKGIESDILADGSLDYPEEILSGFDFVVASVHSNLRMDQEKATARLIRAIENPHTTILGHPTGRLLLSREGYPIDHRKVIDACAANRVAIEINANPQRLDLDWRWHRYASEKGVWLSINPDAHRTGGLHDMQYGVLVARKGGLSAANCLNALGREELADYFIARKRSFH